MGDEVSIDSLILDYMERDKRYKSVVNVMKNAFNSLIKPPISSPKLEDIVNDYSNKRKLIVNSVDINSKKSKTNDSSEDFSDSSLEEEKPSIPVAIQTKRKSTPKQSSSSEDSSDDSEGEKSVKPAVTPVPKVIPKQTPKAAAKDSSEDEKAAETAVKPVVKAVVKPTPKAAAKESSNSMHNNCNNNQNCAQNSNDMQNNCQSLIPGLMDPVLDLKAVVEQQKRILSLIQRPLQSPDITSNEDIPPNESICFKCLPKYKVIKTIIEVKTIGSLSDKGFEDYFNLNVLDLNTIHRNSQQIQLRFCYINDIQTKEQKDCVPEYLSIDVNNQRVFQYTEAKETNTPFDLTEFCVFGTNTLRFSMKKQNYHFLMPCAYEMSFVSYETPESFLLNLKQKDCQYLSPEWTQSLIQTRIQGLSQDEDIISVINTDTKVKLICPLSCRRIETPCRTHTCKHIECFDGLTFFRTNEFRYNWFCPVCQECAPFDSLRIDGYFTEILDKTDETINALFVKSDGTYDLNKGNKESEVIELEDIDSDADTSAVLMKTSNDNEDNNCDEDSEQQGVEGVDQQTDGKDYEPNEQ